MQCALCVLVERWWRAMVESYGGEVCRLASLAILRASYICSSCCMLSCWCFQLERITLGATLSAAPKHMCMQSTRSC